jgi:beta-glucosidase
MPMSAYRVTRRTAGRLALGAAAAAVTATTVGAEPAVAVDEGHGQDVDALLKAMTLEEKVGLLHGATDPHSLGQAGYLPGVPRLGIPEVRLSDGPAGIRVTRNATAMPAPVSLAATFSTELAGRYGAAIGQEGRALGVDVLLAPMVNIVRVPQGGRNFETLGEDPVLAGALVAAEIRGIQGAGLIATVKHYAANNFENGRQSVSVDIDERTLREIYLTAFEQAVAAGVGAVMASYNKVNGVYAAQNPHLLTEILRGDWHFPGFVMSDWFATHSAAPALKAGLDMEMPSGQYYSTLVAAVNDGSLPVSFVDTAVRRILGRLERFGLLGRPRPRPKPDSAGNARTARDVAVNGAVLLRNERATLPLRRGDLASTAVIGPTGRVALVGGGGSAHVVPAHAESPLDALRRRAANPQAVRYAPGIDLDGVAVPASALSGGPEPQVDHVGANALPAGSTYTWSGTLTAPSTGQYDLRIQGAGGAASFGGSITLTLDGVQLGSAGALFGGNSRLLPTADGLANAGQAVNLTAGQPHSVVVKATGDPATPLRVRLAWVTPERRQALIDEAVALAKASGTVLLFAFNEGTEGSDRASLSLPDNQDTLAGAVVAANRRTVVVLNTGDPVTMPWIAGTGAVLQMWYPGQEGADATAALLLGEANPGGKLPETYPKRDADAPTAPPSRYPGIDGHAQYSEGVYVGYRHYDRFGIEPLFPFGHGLSYTTFTYSDISIRRTRSGLTVQFTVRNTGSRSGSEVPQVYVGPPSPAPVPMAVRQLAGFARIGLDPGRRKRCSIDVPERVLQYWGQHGWTLAGGRREVFVGSSSRDLRLKGSITVR